MTLPDNSLLLLTFRVVGAVTSLVSVSLTSFRSVVRTQRSQEQPISDHPTLVAILAYGV